MTIDIVGLHMAMRRICLFAVLILNIVECSAYQDQNCGSICDLLRMNQNLQNTVLVMDRRMMDMEQAMVKLQEENKKLNEKVADLDSSDRCLRCRSQNNSANQRNRRLLIDNETPVAFLASLSSPTKEEHLGVNQNIVFDTVITNLGSAFNVNHGIFIVPQSGLYLISATVLSWIDSEVRASIMVNGQRTVSLFGHGSGGRQEQGTQVAVLKLKLGDTVSVENIDLTDITIWGNRYTSFTGVLLYPME